MKWTEYTKLRVDGQEKNVPWWTNDKIKLHNFCKEHGLPTPDISAIWKHPSEIDLSNAPKEFVLKPSVLHSAKGVMVLKRTDDGKFHEAFSDKALTQDDIIRIQTKAYDECKFKSAYKIFIEEKVKGDDHVGDIPLDYKIYTFYGVPMMVWQFNRNQKPKRAAWFDGNFRPLRMRECIRSEWKLLHHGVHVLPRDWENMLAIASKASILVDSPFISVDMFSSTRGALIGEFTPAPGGPFYGDMYKFTEEFDTTMGKAWEDALERMKAK
ncbi:hypothetical protein JAO85_13785 [Comamonas sp. NyZ500]|uniref:ATP-grasp fold amidoligase family protein n=1 Tax=Comamonas sp. NyZ500 TaxID=2795732 RepID=UPI00192B35D3|nr:ATP-grasp fold amidoligase family protein [Comamonas sp. NyZ500]MBL5978356.1 hypothetical protein [Comamonas sp. NyZ500]